MTVTTVACTVNMIKVVIDDSIGVNYDHSSVTRVIPQVGLPLLEVSFRIISLI